MPWPDTEDFQTKDVQSKCRLKRTFENIIIKQYLVQIYLKIKYIVYTVIDKLSNATIIFSRFSRFQDFQDACHKYINKLCIMFVCM